MSFGKRYFEISMPTDGKMGCSMALIGASRSGKTTFMKYIIKNHFAKHITVMFSQNPHADIYSDLGKKIIVCDTYHPELLRETHELNKECDNKYPFLFISDDMVDPKMKGDVEITRALTIYRNANISTLFSFQGRTMMNAVGRNNLNYVAIFKQQTPLEYENVVKEFLSMWLPQHLTMKQMVSFVMRATQDHHFFFIDNIEGCCYISKLAPHQIADS
jgi:ABC-type cobalamin/Fe3+-siderophores transport system ATPase subunit